MNRRMLFIVNAVVLLLMGLGFLLIPDTLLTLFGATVGATGILMARSLGTVQFGNAVLCWVARDHAESPAGTAIVIALFLEYLITIVTTSLAQLSGVFNALGWFYPILSIVFALLFGYAWLADRDTRADLSRPAAQE